MLTAPLMHGLGNRHQLPQYIQVVQAELVMSIFGRVGDFLNGRLFLGINT